MLRDLADPNCSKCEGRGHYAPIVIRRNSEGFAQIDFDPSRICACVEYLPEKKNDN